MDATVTVTAVDPVGPDTVAVEVETPEGFAAAPGQFVRLGATIDGEEYARFYTLSSDVGETFEVTVSVDPAEGGPFTDYLAHLDPGDRLTMSGPFGDQRYEGEPRVVVLAGGPGVGAAVAIGERALADGAGVALVYRYRGEAPVHADRLDALREAGAAVTVTDGSIADAVADAVTGAAGEQAFVYGFEAFVDDARRALADAGADPDEAKVESFG